MRKSLSIGALAFFALGAAACATLPQPPSTPALSYRQAVEILIAATRTQDDSQSTALRELQPCRFAYDISPGRQSTLQFTFDVRQLDLNAVSTATGQIRHSAFAREIACAKDQGFCVNYTGLPVPFVGIAAPTAEDFDRALGALRAIDAVCRSSAPVF